MSPNPNGANQYKRCKNCLKEKTIKDFELRSDTNIIRNSCKECENTRKQAWYENNKFPIKMRTIAKKYSLSEKDYMSMIESHRDLCAICGKNETSPDGRTKKVKSLAIDHNHKTGIVRGLLCWRCNALIGYSRESAEILASAIKYLKNYE